MSSWTKSPARGLTDPITKKEEPREDPEATFTPKLDMSNPKLRSKVYSSSYGVKSPKEFPEQKRASIDPAEAPLDPEATFHPNLEQSDPTIRAKARSSNYGVAIPAKVEVEPPRPSFSPEITKTEIAETYRAKARSSGYGKVVARAPSASPPTPDRDSFRPQLPEDPIRQVAPSSGYANGAYRPPVNKSRRESVESQSGERVLRYSLLRDKPDPDEKPQTPEPASPGRAFVLDGVKVALTNVTLVKQGVATAKMAEILPPPPRSEAAIQLKDRVHTQGYGKETYTPPRGEKVQKEEKPSFKFARPTSADEPRKLVETPEALALREQAKKNARSQGYGSSYVPPKAEKPVVEEEPKFKFTKGSVLEEARKDPPKSVEEFATYGLPKTARAKADGDTIKAKARAAGYGSKGYQPPKGEKKEVVSMPGFIPGGRRSSVKQLSELEPAPRSSLNETVESHGYGKVPVPVKAKRESEGPAPSKAARGSKSKSARSPGARSGASSARSVRSEEAAADDTAAMDDSTTAAAAAAEEEHEETNGDSSTAAAGDAEFESY